MAKPKKHDPDKLRNKILDAAITVLRQKEFSECLTDEIAKKAGIGKGTIYLYFKSKEDIYYSILLKLTGEMKAIADSVYESGLDPDAQVLKLLKLLHGFVLNNSHILMLIKEEAKPAKGKLHKKFHEAFADLLRSISRILNKGIKEKKFMPYPPVFVSSLLLSAILTVSRFKLDKHFKNINVPPEMIMDIFMRGIARKP